MQCMTISRLHVFALHDMCAESASPLLHWQGLSSNQFMAGVEETWGPFLWHKTLSNKLGSSQRHFSSHPCDGSACWLCLQNFLPYSSNLSLGDRLRRPAPRTSGVWVESATSLGWLWTSPGGSLGMPGHVSGGPPLPAPHQHHYHQKWNLHCKVGVQVFIEIWCQRLGFHMPCKIWQK